MCCVRVVCNMMCAVCCVCRVMCVVVFATLRQQVVQRCPRRSPGCATLAVSSPLLLSVRCRDLCMRAAHDALPEDHAVASRRTHSCAWPRLGQRLLPQGVGRVGLRTTIEVARAPSRPRRSSCTPRSLQCLTRRACVSTMSSNFSAAVYTRPDWYRLRPSSEYP